jgi:hypothetical protein
MPTYTISYWSDGTVTTEENVFIDCFCGLVSAVVGFALILAVAIVRETLGGIHVCLKGVIETCTPEFLQSDENALIETNSDGGLEEDHFVRIGALLIKITYEAVIVAALMASFVFILIGLGFVALFGPCCCCKRKSDKTEEAGSEDAVATRPEVDDVERGRAAPLPAEMEGKPTSKPDAANAEADEEIFMVKLESPLVKRPQLAEAAEVDVEAGSSQVKEKANEAAEVDVEAGPRQVKEKANEAAVVDVEAGQSQADEKAEEKVEE